MSQTSTADGRSLRISVVTPTLGRPGEVRELLMNLSGQTRLPAEVILVDAAPPDQTATQRVVEEKLPSLPFPVIYVRHGGGTAIQRNVGIERAGGEYIAFIDDDIRLEPTFLATIVQVFEEDAQRRVGGVAGYIDNQYLDAAKSERWRWYKRLKLFSTYEPGRYDFESGYPINRYMQPPFEGCREIDFMGAGCAVWRRGVFAGGLRFSDFFSGHGVLEDAHLALTAGRNWRLLECGSAHCRHLHAASSREDARLTAYKSAVNYRYVFISIVRKRTWQQELRFWRVQVVDLIRFFVTALRSREKSGWLLVQGKIQGILAAARLEA